MIFANNLWLSFPIDRLVSRNTNAWWVHTWTDVLLYCSGRDNVQQRWNPPRQSIFNWQRLEPGTKCHGLTSWWGQNPNKLGLKERRKIYYPLQTKRWGRGVTAKQGPREQRKHKGSVETLLRESMHIHIGVGLVTILSVRSCGYTPEHAQWRRPLSEHAQLRSTRSGVLSGHAQFKVMETDA